jgi:hypothetical protein
MFEMDSFAGEGMDWRQLAGQKLAQAGQARLPKIAKKTDFSFAFAIPVV